MTVILGSGGSSGFVEAPSLASVLTGVSLESPAGSLRLSGGSPWSVLPGASGLSGPGFDVDSATSPSFDGAVLRTQRPVVEPIEVFLPLYCDATTATAAESYTSELRAATRRSAGALRLVGSRYDGTSRSLSVVRVQSDGDSWLPESWQHWWRVIPLRLRALDPWWSGDPRSITWRVGSGSSLLPFLLPTLLASAAVLGNENPLDVGGEVDTYPTWTLTGPFSSATVERGDGLSFTVDEPLLVGETLTIKTDPRESDRVSHSSAGNWWQYLTPGSQLFPLRAGVPEAVTVTAASASGAASVRVDWSPRFEALL